MHSYTKDELQEILTLHKKWLDKEAGGVKANFSSADITGFNLEAATGELKYIKSLKCEKYAVVYTFDRIYIGCKSHSIEEWRTFTAEEIAQMDGGDFEWFNNWKPVIMQLIEMSPALEYSYE
ncbi:MAG: hypothetical protein JHC33_01260 [Ignisphaera sp.]|nr:hypothetical protein [Ignisphaera sp.]